MKVPLRKFVVLTDRRLLLLPETDVLARPKSEVLFEAPLDGVRVAGDGKENLYSWFELEWADATRLKLNFPRAERKRAEGLLERLRGEGR